MNVAEAIAKFKDSWDRATGPGSKFSETLTPEGRHIRRLLEDAPPEAARVLLGGVSAETGGASPAPAPGATHGHYRQNKTASPSKRTAAVLAAVSLALCYFSSWIAPKIGAGITSLVGAALAGAAVAAAMLKPSCGKKDSPKPPANPCATPMLAIRVDPAALDKAVRVFSTALSDVIANAKEKEDDASLGFDVTASKAFGDWVQKFVDEANRDGADDGFAMLKDELVSKLRTMGISVFDHIRRGKDGKAALPPRDSFRDSRPEGRDEFTRVFHAAVYSRRGTLAVGELA